MPWLSSKMSTTGVRHPPCRLLTVVPGYRVLVALSNVGFVVHGLLLGG
jgi:hypothetical protein